MKERYFLKIEWADGSKSRSVIFTNRREAANYYRKFSNCAGIDKVTFETIHDK